MHFRLGETQEKLRGYSKNDLESLLKCTKGQGKVMKSFLSLSKCIQAEGKFRRKSGETQKIIFRAYKSAGKLRGNSKNHF